MRRKHYKDTSVATLSYATNALKFRANNCLVITGILLVTTASFLFAKQAIADPINTSDFIKVPGLIDSARDLIELPPVPVDPNKEHIQIVTVRDGDSLAEIFTRLGLSQEQLQNILTLKQVSDLLTNLKPGQRLEFLIDSDHSMKQLTYAVNPIQDLQIIRGADGFKVIINQHEPEIQLKTIAGTITSSFAKDAAKAHLHPKQIKEFMQIFTNDINFSRDVKKGARFSIVYENFYADKEKIGSGDIVAAELINQGKTYQAIRYIDENGHYDYYAPNGQSLQRAFIRAPVNYHRISSFFSLSRLDPVSGLFARPHKGVDFAAPKGTPIRAAGNGKIIFVGTKNGYGNTVIIQHGTKYKTLYGHMDHFAIGIYKGMDIQEGQLIGYVGATGRVTGPHLHYEFLVDNAPYNPLTVVLPRAKAIAVAYRQKFVAKAKQLLALLAPQVLIRQQPTVYLAKNTTDR